MDSLILICICLNLSPGSGPALLLSDGLVPALLSLTETISRVLIRGCSRGGGSWGEGGSAGDSAPCGRFRGQLCGGLRGCKCIGSVWFRVQQSILGGLSLLQQSLHTTSDLMCPTGSSVFDLIAAVVAGLPSLGSLPELTAQALCSVIQPTTNKLFRYGLDFLL